MTTWATATSYIAVNTLKLFSHTFQKRYNHNNYNGACSVLLDFVTDYNQQVNDDRAQNIKLQQNVFDNLGENLLHHQYLISLHNRKRQFL